MVDNAPSVGILSCSKNPVGARDKNIQQGAKSLSLAGAETAITGSKQPLDGVATIRQSTLVKIHENPD